MENKNLDLISEFNTKKSKLDTKVGLNIFLIVISPGLGYFIAWVISKISGTDNVSSGILLLVL